MNYAKEAQAKWPQAVIRGSEEGRFAVVTKDGSLVYLATTESQQRSIGLGCDNPTLVDLKPRVVPNIRETAEDRYEERLRAKRGLL